MKIFKLIRILQIINKKISKLNFLWNDCYLVNVFMYNFIDYYFDFMNYNILYHFDEKYRYIYDLYFHKYDNVKKLYKYNFEVNDRYIKDKLFEIIDNVYSGKYVLHKKPSEKIKDEINFIITKQIHLIF